MVWSYCGNPNIVGEVLKLTRELLYREKELSASSVRRLLKRYLYILRCNTEQKERIETLSSAVRRGVVNFHEEKKSKREAKRARRVQGKPPYIDLKDHSKNFSAPMDGIGSHKPSTIHRFP